MRFALALLSLACVAHGAVKDFLQLGGVPLDATLSAMKHNTLLFNETMAELQPNDVFVIPNTTFHMLGGVVTAGIRDVVVQLDGTVAFSNDREVRPVAYTMMRVS